MFIITDNPKLARGIDPNPIVIPDNGPLTALIAVLPLQVRQTSDVVLIFNSRFLIDTYLFFHLILFACLIYAYLYIYLL